MDHGVDQGLHVNPFKGMCCAKIRNIIWELFEDPNSSRAAEVYTNQPCHTTSHEYCAAGGHRQLNVPAGQCHHAHPLHCARVPGVSQGYF